MLTNVTARERVVKGAAVLDTIRPGWEHRIDYGLLDMMSCTECILGQLFGRWSDGISAMGYNKSDLTLFCEDFGDAFAGKMFKDLWIEAIADRLSTETETPGCGVRVLQSVGTARAE